jgi:restriction system protein
MPSGRFVTMTIVEAIRKVMQTAARPMTVQEIYDAIIAANFYAFKTDDPLHVVATQARRHCMNLDFASASALKYFELLSNGKYQVLSKPVTLRATSTISRTRLDKIVSLTDLRQMHALYLHDFRQRALEEVKRIEPDAFEIFCRNLLRAYGFQDVMVTQRSRDGGIDGHGRLKVGFAYFNVAFQCKRWTRKPLGRPEIDQFRGAIQGLFEQGIFFTTASFSQDAERSSFKVGAVPIVLVNGSTIVDIMLQHSFGIETDHLPVYSLALDLAVTE